MKKRIGGVIFISILFVVGSIVLFLNDRMPVKPTVVHEDTSACEEFDITNKPLEEYLNSIEDSTKKELLEKYFYLPSELIPEEELDSSLDPVSQAGILSNLSTEELKDIVDEMEAKLPELQEKQNKEYNKAMKEILEE